MIKAKYWDGETLTGTWDVTIKLDGVRCLIRGGGAYSRAGILLPGIPRGFKDGDYEFFFGSFLETISLARTHQVSGVIGQEHFYSLLPLDERLYVGQLLDPGPEAIQEALKAALSQKHEGLILRQGDKWLKIKPNRTYDVSVTGLIEGAGQFAGKLGAFVTEMGRVGSGFTVQQRQEFYDESFIGRVVEVECMQTTENNKFRHARFKRLRPDK